MKGLVIAVVALLVVLAVSVGAYNITTGSNNKPMPLYDIVKTFSELKLDFQSATGFYQRFIDHFERISSARYEEYYKDINILDDEISGILIFETIESWLANFSYVIGSIYRILVCAYYLILFLIGVICDVLSYIIQLLTLAYTLLTGVPAA